MNFVPFHFYSMPRGFLAVLLLLVTFQFSAGKGGASGLSAHFAGADGAATVSSAKEPEGISGAQSIGFGSYDMNADGCRGTPVGTEFRGGLQCSSARGDAKNRPASGLTGSLCWARGNPFLYQTNGNDLRLIVPAQMTAAMAVSAAARFREFTRRRHV